jgi:hypothetical protein
MARQISVWPFAARMQRLFLLVDPSAPRPALRDGLVRAMQQAYFRSDGLSQTRSVREAALAAHYVLKHNNRDALPLDQVCASAAVAAVRGQIAFVALSGDASAFAWRNGRLTGHYAPVRLARPLGLETDPGITLWSTRLEPGDRLLLVCGAEGHADALEVLEEILSRDLPSEETEQQVSEALGAARPAGALVVGTAGGLHQRSRSHLRLVPPPEKPPVQATALVNRMRWVWSAIGLFVLAALVIGAIAATAPTTHAPAARAAGSDTVYPVAPEMAVQLGQSGNNVIDLAVGDDALYTLDVVESAVRTFGLDALDQQPAPETLLVRTGAAIAGTSHRLAQPVAIQYLGSGLAIVDQARAVVEVGHDRALSLGTPPSSASWGELGALGTDLSAHLFVLDSAARQLLDYPIRDQRPQDPPQLVLEASTAGDLAFDRAAEVIGVEDSVYVRFDDGSVRRFDAQGHEQSFRVQPPDGAPLTVSGMTPDHLGGLYLADANHARVVHTLADGTYLRELRNPALGGLRQLKSSLDGHRLYGLVTAGVLTLAVPDINAHPRDRN